MKEAVNVNKMSSTQETLDINKNRNKKKKNMWEETCTITENKATDTTELSSIMT